MIRSLQSLVAMVVIAAALAAASSASAAHVQCGDVITQDTTLDSDLEGCPNDGLVIGADGVTVDLNGHEISGPGGGPGYGGGSGANGIYGNSNDGVDDSAGYDRLVVKGGEIELFDSGVKLRDVQGASVTGLEIYAASFGVLLVESDRNRIDANDIYQTGYGIYPVESSDNRIARNLLHANTFGMYPVESNHNVIVRNTVTGSSILGIQVTTGSSDNRISENEILGNASTGLLVSNAYRNVLTRNVVVDHSFAGISLNDADGSVVRHNRVANETLGPLAGPFGVGILALVESDWMTIADNTVAGYRTGFRVGGSRGVALSRNVARDNQIDGLWVENGAPQTLVNANRSEGNGDDGIDVEDGSARVRKNRANFNGDLGIEAAPGVDGGGNRASGNGNPAQCVGVTCGN